MLKPKSLILLMLVTVTLSGCRGYRSESTPIHLNPNLDWQSKHKSQKFTQQPPEGTVAWGYEKSFNDPVSRETFFTKNTLVSEGKYSSGLTTRRIPILVTKDLVLKGQERYNIYCAVCHAHNGEGNGLVVQRGFPPAPDLTESKYKTKRDGEIFNTIKNGIRNMPSYDKQLTTEEKWAVVAYLRALQRVKSMHKSDVPVGLEQTTK